MFLTIDCVQKFFLKSVTNSNCDNANCTKNPNCYKTLNKTKLNNYPSSRNKTHTILNSKIPDRPKMGTLTPDCCDQMKAQTPNSMVDQIRQKTARDLLWGPDKARHLAVLRKSVVVSLSCHNLKI